MFRPLSDTLIDQANRTPGRLIAIALALVLAGLLAQSASASDNSMEADANNFAAACTAAGGVASAHYEFNPDGSLASIRVSCVGGQLDGQICGVDADGWSYCSNPFTRTPQTPVESTRPGAGTVGGVLETSGQGAPATDPASGAVGPNGTAVNESDGRP